MIYPETSKIARAQHKFIAFQMAKKYFVSIGIDGFLVGCLVGWFELFRSVLLFFHSFFICLFRWIVCYSVFVCLSFDSYISVFQFILYMYVLRLLLFLLFFWTSEIITFNLNCILPHQRKHNFCLKRHTFSADCYFILILILLLGSKLVLWDLNW